MATLSPAPPMNPTQLIYFEEFSHNERAVGGPDPHMTLTGELFKDQPVEERWWIGGLYAGIYTVPSVEVVHEFWPLTRVLMDSFEMEPWLKEHWAGLTLRRERRAVRTPMKLAMCLTSYAEWLRDRHYDPMQFAGWRDYDAAFKDIQQVYGFGRYSALKALEFLRRYVDPRIPAMPDIRAAGGWSPVASLELIYPEEVIEKPAHAEHLADQLKAQLEMDYPNEPFTYYLLQTLLCDYHQSYVGQRQYPGRALDSELAHLRQIEPHWQGQFESRILGKRSELFPHRALGELNGWNGPREELGSYIHRTGNTWSDLKYDYATGSPVVQGAFQQTMLWPDL